MLTPDIPSSSIVYSIVYTVSPHKKIEAWGRKEKRDLQEPIPEGRRGVFFSVSLFLSWSHEREKGVWSRINEALFLFARGRQRRRGGG